MSLAVPSTNPTTRKTQELEDSLNNIPSNSEGFLPSPRQAPILKGLIQVTNIILARRHLTILTTAIIEGRYNGFTNNIINN
jgi:hypothetical protein